MVTNIVGRRHLATTWPSGWGRWSEDNNYNHHHHHHHHHRWPNIDHQTEDESVGWWCTVVVQSAVTAFKSQFDFNWCHNNLAQSDTPQTSETTRIQNCIKILPSTYWQSSVGMEIKISFHNFYSYRIGSNCCLRYYWCLDWIQQLTHVNNLNLNSKFRSLVQTKYKPKSVINWNHFLLPTVKYK